MPSPPNLQQEGRRAPEEPAGVDPDEPAVGKTVIIGLGNRYLGDDGIGIRVAEELRQRDLGAGVVVRTHQTFDLWLFSEYSGASGLIIIDALRSGSPPGTVTEYIVTPRPDIMTSILGLHSLGLHDLVDFASRMGLLNCPVIIVGIEPNACAVGEGLSPELEKAVPQVIARVFGKLGRSTTS